MTQARKLNVIITDTRTIHLPVDVPVGAAEIIVLFDPSTTPTASARRPGEGSWKGLVSVSDNFDAPLPDAIQRVFEGG